jgi:HK97 family phage portal protein
MANIFQKLFQGRKEKQNIISSGFDLMKRLVSPEMSATGQLEQYGKSLYVFACISKTAEKVGSIEIELYRILNSKGDTKKIESHLALDLVYRPNEFQTKNEFFEILMINLKTTGDAFIYKVRNKGGRPVELWNLRPDLMTVVSDPQDYIKEYKFNTLAGTTISIAPEDIIHFKYPDPLREHLGMSPLRPAQYRVETEAYATKYQRDFFLNNARPDAIIKSTKNLTKKQKGEMRSSWNMRHRGPGKNSKIAVLEAGLEYQQISLSQKEMDYIESMRFTRDDILVAFKTPKSVVAITDEVNYANAKMGMEIFLRETIVPEINRIVEKLTEELIRVDFEDTLYFWYKNPVPEDREMALKEYDNGIKNNWLLINEARQREGLQPVAGGWSFYMPLMNQAMGGLTNAQTKSISKSVIKAIIDDSNRNEKIILKNQEEKAKVKFNFKGHYFLQQKMAMIEEFKKIVETKINNKSKKKIGKKKTKTPMITDPEMKKAYADFINKKIDLKATSLKTGMTSFIEGQKARVLLSIKKVAKALKQKDFKISQIFNVDEEQGLTLSFITPYIEEFLKESGKESLLSIAPQESFEMNKRIEAFIKKRAEMFAESVNNTTLQGLESTLAEGIEAGEGITALADRVESVYQEFPAYRSEMIARTEATAANNEGILESYKQSEVVNGKEWINAGDDRVREEHQNGTGVGGEIVAIDKPFSNGLMYPQEPNCRCVLGGAFIE